MRRIILISHGCLCLIFMLLFLVSMIYARVAKLDQESETFYRMARYFMARDEERIFHRLATPELRQEFIRAFWEIRDPDSMTEENEFRDEVEKRFEFINSHFRESNRDGWKTARGMIYIIFGPPNDLYDRPAISDPIYGGIGIIRWFYNDFGFYVQFIDRQGFGVYELDMMNTPLILMDYLEMAKKHQLTGSNKDLSKRYLKFSIVADAKQDSLTVSVAMRDLAFELGPGNQQFAKLHIAFNLYLENGKIVTKNEERRLSIGKQELNDGYLHFAMTVPLQKGRNNIDLLVADQIGGKMNRQLFSLKKK